MVSQFTRLSIAFATVSLAALATSVAHAAAAAPTHATTTTFTQKFAEWLYYLLGPGCGLPV